MRIQLGKKQIFELIYTVLIVDEVEYLSEDIHGIILTVGQEQTIAIE